MIKTILNLPLSLVQYFLNKLSQITGYFLKKIKEPIVSNFLSLNGFFQASALAVALFVICWALEPFGISNFISPNKTLLLISLSFGAFLGLCISLFALPAIFTRFFNRQRWTVGKAILGNIISAFFLGLSVMVYGNQTGLTNFDLPSELMKFTVLAGLGAFVYNFALHSILIKKYQKKSLAITEKMNQSGIIHNESLHFPIVKFTGANDVISLIPNQLIKIDTGKYSSDFLYQNLFGTAKKQLDIPEKEVKQELANFMQFIQIDKGVFVNQNAIIAAEGDASGIKLKVSKVESLLAVNRKFENKL